MEDNEITPENFVDEDLTDIDTGDDFWLGGDEHVTEDGITCWCKDGPAGHESSDDSSTA